MVSAIHQHESTTGITTSVLLSPWSQVPGPEHLATLNWIHILERICFKKGLGFPGRSVIKNLLANAGDTGLIPGSGRSPREGNDKPIQYSCLKNPMDRGAWWATVHGATKVRHDWACSLNSKFHKTELIHTIDYSNLKNAGLDLLNLFTEQLLENLAQFTVGKPT